MSLLVRAARPLVPLLPHRLARPLGWVLGGAAGAARLEAVSAARFGLVRFCRHLTLEGWEHLEAAQAEGRGVLALFPPVGRVEIAPLPLGVYGGPLQVWGETLLAGLPHRARERFRLEELGGPEEARRGLAAGGRVGLPWGSGEERRRAVELARETGAPALPVICRPGPAGCWRLVVEPPATPEALASLAFVSGGSGSSSHPSPPHRV